MGMIGGRNGWIAWPAGLLCAGVVGGLVWLAAPGVPSAVLFVGNTLRNASPTWDEPQSLPAEVPLTEDCRSLYPGLLWIALGWNPEVVLVQSTALPVTSAAAVRDVLQPKVRMTCAWRNSAGGSVSTTLSTVDAGAPGVAEPALAAVGFTCTASGGGIRCVKTTGSTTEDEIVRDGIWLSTTESGWHPPGYTDQLAERLWP